MLRFFEPEVDPGWPPVSGTEPDHKLSHLLTLAWESEVSGMRNDAVFPLLSSSLLGRTSFANNESRVRGSNVSAELERFNSYSGDFFITSQDCDSFQLLSSPPLNPTSGEPFMAVDPSNSKLLDLTSHRHDAMAGTIRKQRKHTITAGDQMITVCETKRQKTMYEEKLQPPLSDESNTVTQLMKASSTVKKSQKLGDKITALQQLVSPFGKTDTASVLQEASVYIKVLHEQIRVLTSPYFGMKPSPGFQGNGGERLGLLGRGLCLVPVSSTIAGLTDQQPSDHCALERTAWPETAVPLH